MPRADVGSAGMVGEAIARGGAAVSQEGQAFADRYADAKRQADASDIVAGVSRQLNDAQFRWSKTPDAQQAFDGFNGEAETVRKNTLGSISDPAVASYVTRQFNQEAIARSEETRRTAFGLESSKRRGDLDTNLVQTASQAATAQTPELRAQLMDRGIAQIHGAVSAGWVTPEMGAQHVLKFQSDIDEAGARRALNSVLDKNDPDAAYGLASAIEDPTKFPGLLPEKREILAREIGNAGDRMNARLAAAASRADALSERMLKQSQAYNAAQLVVQARAGKLDERQLPELVRTQQLSESGYAAIVAALDREEKGHDNPIVAGNLRAAVESDHANADDINNAFAAGQISTTTHSAMMEKWGERQHQKDDAVERGAFQTLKTIASGTAVEQGLIKDDSVRARAEQAWSQANGEWNRRVLLNKEDPLTVLTEIAPKYASVIPQHPTWLAPSKWGDVKSIEDVASAYRAAKGAFDGKQLSGADFQNEAQLLENYRVFYQQKAIREGAATSIPFKPGGKPVAAKPATGAPK